MFSEDQINTLESAISSKDEVAIQNFFDNLSEKEISELDTLLISNRKPLMYAISDSSENGPSIKTLMNIKPIREAFEADIKNPTPEIKSIFTDLARFSPENIRALLESDGLRNNPNLIFLMLQEASERTNREVIDAISAGVPHLLTYAVRHGTPSDISNVLRIEEIAEDKKFEIFRALAVVKETKNQAALDELVRSQFVQDVISDGYYGNLPLIFKLLKNITDSNAADDEKTFAMMIMKAISKSSDTNSPINTVGLDHDGDFYEESALSYAIKNDQPELAEKFLDMPNIDVTIPDNNAIKYALEKGYYKLAYLLYQKGAKNLSYIDGPEAVKALFALDNVKNDENFIFDILEGSFDPEVAKEIYNQTPNLLKLAIQKGDPEGIRKIIQIEAFQKDRAEIFNALNTAIELNSMNGFMALMSSGPIRRVIESDDKYAHYVAVYNGDLEKAKTLLETADNFLLRVAAERGHEHIVEKFLSGSANTQLEILFALIKNGRSSSDVLGDTIIKVLQKTGLNINETYENESLLSLTVNYQRQALAMRLLELNDIDPSIPDHKAFHQALSLENYELASKIYDKSKQKPIIPYFDTQEFIMHRISAGHDISDILREPDSLAALLANLDTHIFELLLSNKLDKKSVSEAISQNPDLRWFGDETFRRPLLFHLLARLNDGKENVQIFLDAILNSQQAMPVNYVGQSDDPIFNNESALSFLIKNGRLELAEKLIDVPGVDVTIPNNNAMKYALENGYYELAHNLYQKSRMIPPELITRPEMVKALFAFDDIKNNKSFAFYLMMNTNPEVANAIYQEKPNLLEFTVGRKCSIDEINRIIAIEKVQQPKNRVANAVITDALNTALKKNRMENFAETLSSDSIRKIAETDEKYALYVAVYEGNVEKIKELLESFKGDLTADDNFLVRLAAFRGHEQTVEILLQNPSIIEMAGRNDGSVLGLLFELTAQSKSSPDALSDAIIRIIRGTGVDVNQIYDTGSLLCQAVNLESDTLALRLLELDNVDPSVDDKAFHNALASNKNELAFKIYDKSRTKPTIPFFSIPRFITNRAEAGYDISALLQDPKILAALLDQINKDTFKLLLSSKLNKELLSTALDYIPTLTTWFREDPGFMRPLLFHLLVKLDSEENAQLLLDSILKHKLLYEIMINQGGDPNDPIFKDESALSYLITNKKFDWVERLLSIPNIDVTQPLNKPIISAFNQGNYKLVQHLYELGGRLPPHLAEEWLIKARTEQDKAKVACLEEICETNEGSLFVNLPELKKAARYVNENFLVKPYINGLYEGLWASQRTIAELSDGRVMDVPPEFLHGIPEAMALANGRKPTDLVTLEEISQKAGIPKAMIGQVKIKEWEKALEQQTGGLVWVEKIVHRPNHDLTHSLRAASYITVLHQLFSTGETRNDIYGKLDENRLEQLQLMMLFSVIGREDETGFEDSKKSGGYLYQSYRAVSGIEFLKYCKENWEGYYKDVFKTEEALYRAALTVEIMGFPNYGDVDAQAVITPLMLIFMYGYSDESFIILKEQISKLPNNNMLKSYTDDDLKKLFSEKDIPNKTKDEASDINLQYINFAHGSDLLRCYGPDKKSADVSAMYNRIFNSLLEQNKLGKPGEKSPAELTIKYFQYTRSMLDKFGEKTTTDIEKNPFLIKEIMDNASMIENFLFKNIDEKKSYGDVKNQKIKLFSNGVLKEITIEALVAEMGVDKIFNLSKDLKANLVALLVSKYVAKYILKDGNYNLNANRFDFCHYKTQAQLGQRISIDVNKVEHRDLAKEVETTVSAIDELRRPAYVRRTAFRFEDPAFKELVQATIKHYCEDGVALVFQDGKMHLEFSKQKIAEQVFSSLLEHGIISQMPALSPDPYGQVTLAEITQAEYSDILPFIKFRQVTPPEEHSVEDNLVASNGELSVMNLMNEYSASVCLHNTRPLVSGSGGKTGLEFYFNQLEHPSKERTVRRQEFTQYQRTIIKDQLTGQYIKRRLVKATLPESQPPETQNPPLSDYRSADQSQIARDVEIERGTAKNTLFNKKNAQTLLSPKGKQRLFPGIEYWRNFPVGIVFDVKELHLHGERFIWENNVRSNDKFWIHDSNAEPRSPSVSMMTLQTNLKTAVEGPGNTIIAWNEFLAGNSKTAVKALMCPGDPYDNDTALLTYRVNLLAQAKFIKDEFGVDVPLLIADGKNPPLAYTEAKMQSDISATVQLLISNQYPYLDQSRTTDPTKENYKLKCEEQTVLFNFFQSLTGLESNEVLEFYPHPREYTKADEPYNDYVARIDEENTKKLLAYLSKLNLTPEKIKHYLDKMEVIGSESRERQYMQEKLATSMQGDTTIIKSLLFRNIALGHENLLKELFDHIRDNKIKMPVEVQTDLNMQIVKKIFDTINHPLNGHAEIEKALALLKIWPEEGREETLKDIAQALITSNNHGKILQDFTKGSIAAENIFLIALAREIEFKHAIKPSRITTQYAGMQQSSESLSKPELDPLQICCSELESLQKTFDERSVEYNVLNSLKVDLQNEGIERLDGLFIDLTSGDYIRKLPDDDSQSKVKDLMEKLKESISKQARHAL